ncbi:hypothetical protein FHL15_007216 [Xylaria flabelliformis]|uniref:Uncharacterized protein n=1 Tax=Xylaria flabelliformis TaxID=2512241 RepID=A0A553HVE0_9PEZI|nr:hypothetical protein FHL15_007216 [Xylaria flabelliformis]
MPLDNTLKTELYKLAKKSNIQAGLPFILRGLPVAAIVVGEAIAKVSGGSNRIEERMLGLDETVLLNMPSQSPSIRCTENEREYAQQGVMMMCVRCWKARKEPALLAKLRYNDGNRWIQDIDDEQTSFARGDRLESFERRRQRSRGSLIFEI